MLWDFWKNRRWAFPDLADVVLLPETAPIPEPPPLSPHETAFERLHRRARDLGVNVLDLRGLPRNVHYDPREWGWFRDDEPKKNIPKRARAKGRRLWAKVTGIMLHTAAVDMGPKRFLGTPCHGGIADDATIVLCHPLDVKVWHGNGANSFTVGNEISGHSSCTDLQAEAAKILVTYQYEEIQEHDPHAMVMMGHIQSHPNKVRDPGEEIWQKVALPMMEQLAMKEGPVIGKGHRIPDIWKTPAVPVAAEDADTNPLS